MFEKLPQIDETDSETLQTVFDLFVISEKNNLLLLNNECLNYMDRNAEKLLSNKLITFSPITAINTEILQTICDFYAKSKTKSLLCLSKACLKFFDENADEVLKTIDQLIVSPQILIQIIRRDTFGVKEIDLFNSIIKWVTKYRRDRDFNDFDNELFEDF